MRREARLVIVTTGYIAGFPGEAELEFEATERGIESELLTSRIFFRLAKSNLKADDVPRHLPETVVLS